MDTPVHPDSALVSPRHSFAHLFGAGGTALLRLLPAEMAHDVGMSMLSRGLANHLPSPPLERLTAGLKMRVPGIGDLPHPIGLAAGFDKNARCPGAFARLGFAFVEIGTVTPRPQPGNPKPRLFRRAGERAIINRMGFNSHGALTVANRIKALRWNHAHVPLGINCGKNKETPADRALGDFLQVVETFRDLAKYFVINISSPNTPGLRDLATPEFLGFMAEQLGPALPKVWVKLDPDLSRQELQKLIEVITDRGFQGVILSNTHRVNWPEPGGLSGHPLLPASTACLEWAYQVHQGRLPMIASGGILSGADIFQKIARGALAVQIYTALVYRGPWVVALMLEELAQELKLRGFACAEDALFSYYR